MIRQRIENISAEQKSDHEAGDKAGNEELADAHVPDDPVDQHDHAGRDHEPQGTRSGQGADGEVVIVIPLLVSSGIVILPTVAVVAADDPLTAAKNVQARMLTWINRPGIASIQGDKPLKRFSEILLRKRISPIQMKKGRAIMAELLVLFQAILDIIEPKETSL